MVRFFLYFSWLLVLIGCFLSLYYGEILMMEPCRLCWYQRMVLFPLAVILSVSVYRDDRAVFWYAFPLSFIGAIFALYQVLAMRYSALQICGEGCAEPVFILFNWITFPDLSLIGFVTVGICLVLDVRKSFR